MFSFSESELSNDRPLFLIDGWHIYSDVLLTPDDFEKSTPKDYKEIFIGQYPNFSFLSSAHSPFGNATYHLKLKYSGSPCILSLEIPEIFTDYSLWINGKLAVPNQTTMQFAMVQDADIILSVRNQSHYYSGLTYPPALGLPQTVERMLFLRSLFYGMLCFFSLALSLYAFSAWRLRKSGRRFIHFGLLCLFFAVQCAHPFMHRLHLSGTLWYAIEDTSRLAMLYEVLALCSIEAGFDKKAWYRNIVRPLSLAACVISGLTVFFILPNFGTLINVYAVLLDGYKFVCWSYLIFCAVLGFCTHRQGSMVILFGGSIMGAAMLINIYDNNHFEPIYTGWQTEYAGFSLVLIFWILAVEYEKSLIVQNQQLNDNLEALVLKRTEELNTVLNERKAFFSDLAHNLKAPVAAIRGFTDLILRGNLYLDKELKGYLSQIDSENEELAHRMSALGNLNAYDKITAPKEILEANKFLTLVYNNHEPEACIFGINLKLKTLECNSYVYAQKEKLLILFENLIYNAISFTPEDGEITISGETEGDNILFRVSDTGYGIYEEHLPHIFERFYVGRENQEEGSGLGLYISRLIVEELGGTIAVESAPGFGATFSVRIPKYIAPICKRVYRP